VDIRKTFRYSGGENHGIFDQRSCVADRLYFQFPDETGRCFRGHIPEVRWVVGLLILLINNQVLWSELNWACWALTVNKRQMKD